MLRRIQADVAVFTGLAMLIACSSEQQHGGGQLAHTNAGGPPSLAVVVDAAVAVETSAASHPGARSGGSGLHRGRAAPGQAAQAEAGTIPPDAALEVFPDECLFGCDPVPGALELPVTTADQPPPALSGGTLLATRDGKWLVAADPDRDKLYFIDVALGVLSHERALPAGSEPGRVIEDGSGTIHVALRGRGALLSLGRAPDSQMTERALCAQPRGLAYDAARESVHIACADGKLVTVPSAADGASTRTLDLGRDLRDVLVRGDELLVTRFRASELLRISADGAVAARLLPAPSFVPVRADPTTGEVRPPAPHTPNLAWRAIDIAGKGSALLHQRSRKDEIAIGLGGYGFGSCTGIVQAAVTIGLDTDRTVSVDLADAAVAVDLAANPSGTLLAVASPGNWGAGTQVTLYSLTGLSPLNPRAPAEALENVFHRNALQRNAERQGPLCLAASTRYPTPSGQITSVAFVSDNLLALLEREPAAVSLLHLPSRRPKARIELAQPSRYDTGHALFHMRTPAGVACASCHAEGGDDAHTWSFEGIGERRTQSLRGGLLGSEPFHWDGDMADFDTLVQAVMVERMSVGVGVNQAQSAALGRWIDELPLWAASASDPAQAQRGKALFESAIVGCALCHMGPLLTNNQSVDVGTGAVLQVPALRGVSFRLPAMHNGCAETLRQRFDPACGGDRHGDTTLLSEAQLDDLAAYLETL